MTKRQEAEAIATVLLDTGPDGTRRACNSPECEKDYQHEGECTPMTIDEVLRRLRNNQHDHDAQRFVVRLLGSATYKGERYEPARVAVRCARYEEAARLLAALASHSPAMTVEQACEILCEAEWKGRKDWKPVDEGREAVSGIAGHFENYSPVDVIAIAQGIIDRKRVVELETQLEQNLAHQIGVPFAPADDEIHTPAPIVGEPVPATLGEPFTRPAFPIEAPVEGTDRYQGHNKGAFDDGYEARCVHDATITECPSIEQSGWAYVQAWRAGWWDADRELRARADEPAHDEGKD